MSGGSQHNPNGRQSQLGSGWSPLQLQVANLLARAPQAHMASDRGVTWHTPTPPPHLYQVPAPSPPDPLQVLKSTSNSMFRHTATPPELYRHTPTPPDKHLMRHTPSPGDIKTPTLPPVDLYPHLAPNRDKLRTDELFYARGGVDLSLGGGRASNGAATSPAPPVPAPPVPPLAGGNPPALSVRDAPTINSLIARAQPRPPHARVDALLERLVPSPASPHSVIVHSRVAPTPSPPSSNEDSADSCGAPPGSKRKRKPERTVKVPVPPPPAPAPPTPPVTVTNSPIPPPIQTPVVTPRISPPSSESESKVAPTPMENGDISHMKVNGPEERATTPRPDQPHARRKTRSGSAETIADIAAMIADTEPSPAAPLLPPPELPAELSVDKLHSVLASPDTPRAEPPQPSEAAVTAPEPPAPVCDTPPTPPPAPPAPPAAAPRRRSARISNAEAPNVSVESPSEAKPAEAEASDASSAEPAAVSFVEVENQLEKMFAGIEEVPLPEPPAEPDTVQSGSSAAHDTPKRAVEQGECAQGTRKRRRSAPARPERRAPRGAPPDDSPRKKQQKKKQEARRVRKGARDAFTKDAYDSGSNASSSRSRGPYIQIRGPRDSPLSVSVMNTTTGEEEDTGSRRKGGEEFRNGLRGAGGTGATRGVRGLHASTLGLRYDATTADVTWRCAFCGRGPHADALGDLFGPYHLDTDCDEFRSMEEATRRRYLGEGADEVWLHAACGVWAGGLVCAGARVWGLAGAVWGARAARCTPCGGGGAALACAARSCPARAHLPCARHNWLLRDDFRALCPAHAHLPHLTH